jgi:hypothetical protein
MTEEYEDQIEVAPIKRERYKSTKGDLDKRKITSKITLANARKVKLANQRKAKEEEELEYEIDSGSDYDDSDDEPEPVKPKKKASSSERKILKELEKVKLENEKLKKRKKAKAKTIKKTVIQLPPQHAAPLKQIDITKHINVLDL